jgi:hypothetical protein
MHPIRCISGFYMSMKYEVRPVDPGKSWNIVSDRATIGTLERLATGYLVRLTDPVKVIKRFRMIDALTEALGDDAAIEVIE